MKKILVITYYWPPSGGAGVQRILKFVKYLPKYNVKTFVVTVDPEVASYPVTDNTLASDIPADTEVFRTKTFEPYELYSKLLGKKSIPTGFSNESNPSRFQKFSRFIRGNFFIPDARKGWIKYAFEESCRVIEKENIDTILTTSPPHSVQLVGLKLKKKYKINWISDFRDPWTDIYYYNEFKHLPFARHKDLQLEKKVLESADKVITVSKSLKDLLLQKSKSIGNTKIIVIPNGYDEEDFKNQKDNFPAEFIISYTGTIADSYNAEIFFNSFKKMTERFPEINFKVRFIGSPSLSVINKIKKIGLEKYLEFIPTVSHERSIEFLMQSTILLLVIPEVKYDKGILTGKLFEYLAARKPIICIGPSDGDAAEIIRECNAGKAFDRIMENQLTEYFDELVRRWKLNKNLNLTDNFYKKYSRLNQTAELSRIILDI